MMSDATAVRPRPELMRGITGGLLAGITVDGFLLAVGAASWPASYQWIASGLVGANAYSATSYAWLGLAMHFLISATWGVAFASLWAASEWSRRSVILSGTVYGVLVFVAMQVVATLAHIASPMTLGTAAIYLVDHVVFFGIPLAWWMSRTYQRKVAR